MTAVVEVHCSKAAWGDNDGSRLPARVELTARGMRAASIHSCHTLRKLDEDLPVLPRLRHARVPLAQARHALRCNNQELECATPVYARRRQLCGENQEFLNPKPLNPKPQLRAAHQDVF